MIGVQSAEEDSKISHSLQMTKMQSDLEYKKVFADTKTRYNMSMDMLDMAHATMAQGLATECGYRTVLHRYSALPTDMKVQWAKKVYDLQSDVSTTINQESGPNGFPPSLCHLLQCKN